METNIKDWGWTIFSLETDVQHAHTEQPDKQETILTIKKDSDYRVNVPVSIAACARHPAFG